MAISTLVGGLMFVSMQIYEFLSKSQLDSSWNIPSTDVCLYANIRIFKQITTGSDFSAAGSLMFVSMQIYEFLSKSQLKEFRKKTMSGCLSLCKYTNF